MTSKTPITLLFALGLTQLIANAGFCQGVEIKVVQPAEPISLVAHTEPEGGQALSRVIVADAVEIIAQDEPLLEEVMEKEAQVEAEEDSLRPLQTRDIVTRVSAVNISTNGLGTGAMPEPTDYEKFSEMQPLPNGMLRGASYKSVRWRPSLIQHYPLYFEEAMLERHGHDRWGYLQPFASGFRFYSTIALSPYLKTLQSPCECRYAFGHYRAGNCVPVLKDHVPYDKHAAAVETLSLASLFWAAPL